MENPVSHEQCSSSMGRIHSRVDSVEKISASIETSAQSIKENVDKLTNLMYGNEKADGLITKVSIQGAKLGGVYWLGGVIIIALVGVFVGIIFKK